MRSKKLSPRKATTQAITPKPLIVVKTGTITSRDWKLLNDNGYLCIEHPNPDEFKIVQGFTTVNGNDVTMSALHAISKAGTQSTEASFFRELFRRIYQPQVLGTPKEAPNAN